MNINIKILGTGCQKCKDTYSIVEEAINELKLDVELEKIEDIMEIMKYDVLSTPAVVINNKVKIKGKVPSKSEIIKLLTDPSFTIKEDGKCCCSESNN